MAQRPGDWLADRPRDEPSWRAVRANSRGAPAPVAGVARRRRPYSARQLVRATGQSRSARSSTAMELGRAAADLRVARLASRRPARPKARSRSPAAICRAGRATNSRRGFVNSEPQEAGAASLSRP
jgi:hypothetical protein